MTASPKLLCLGYGYTARAFGASLASLGWQISGTTTSAEKRASMISNDIETQLWDDGPLTDSIFDGVDALLISTPPGAEGCPAFKATSKQIAARGKQFRWIGYLSTNGVYGDHGGAWVDEQSELRGESSRAKRRINAERKWQNLAAENDLPLIMFRLPGIYGPGRSAIDSVRAGTAKRIAKPGQVFSRMHVDDIASSLFASMKKPRLHNLYNLADDEPAPPQDVIDYACNLMNVEPPPLVAFENANLSDMAKSFYTDNKRVSNARMKQALGVSLRYPTYREGLSSIFANEQKAT